MAKRVGVEKAIRMLRELEVLQSQGSTIGEAAPGSPTYSGGRLLQVFVRLDSAVCIV